MRGGFLIVIIQVGTSDLPDNGLMMLPSYCDILSVNEVPAVNIDICHIIRM